MSPITPMPDAVTVFPGYRQPRGTLGHWDWLSPPEHVVAADKFAVGGFSPAVYKGNYRRLNNVRQVTQLVLDIDKVDPSTPDLDTLLDILDPYLYAVYTTHNHTPAAPRLRVILALVRPLTRADYDRAWRGFVERLPRGMVDESARDASRFYFWPSRPRGADPSTHFVLVNPGARLDPSAEPSAPSFRKIADAPAAGPEITADVILADFRGVHGDAARYVRKAAKGERYSHAGSRDNARAALAGALARRYPHHDADELAEALRDSLVITSEPDFDAVGDLVRKIERFQSAERDKEQEQAVEDERERRASVELARRYVSTDPVAALSTTPAADVPEHSWVLLKGQSYYFRVEGEYVGPLTKEEATASARHLLAPSPVETEYLDDKGKKRRASLTDLVEEHGAVVREEVVSFVHQKTTWDHESLVLTRAACRPRYGALDATFDGEIAEWLRTLAGPRLDNLRAWLGYLPQLDYPLVGLYLYGAPSSGKSLLAQGCASLWSTEGATEMSVLVDNFNQAVLRCPLTLAEEALPKGITSTRLRELIAARSHRLKEKNRPDSTLRGSLRFVFTANNRSFISPDDEMTSADIRAFAERFLTIEVPSAASAWLAERSHGYLQREWIDGGRFARHVLWLRGKHDSPEDTKSRFLVDTRADTTLEDYLIVHSGSRSNICAWLWHYLQKPDRVPDDAASIWYDRVQISVGTLYRNWQKFPVQYRLPQISKVARLLDGLASSHVDDKKTGERIFAIPAKRLILWAETSGLATEETMQALFDKHKRGPR